MPKPTRKSPQVLKDMHLHALSKRNRFKRLNAERANAQMEIAVAKRILETKTGANPSLNSTQARRFLELMKHSPDLRVSPDSKPPRLKMILFKDLLPERSAASSPVITRLTAEQLEKLRERIPWDMINQRIKRFGIWEDNALKDSLRKGVEFSEKKKKNSGAAMPKAAREYLQLIDQVKEMGYTHQVKALKAATSASEAEEKNQKKAAEEWYAKANAEIRQAQEFAGLYLLHKKTYQALQNWIKYQSK